MESHTMFMETDNTVKIPITQSTDLMQSIFQILMLIFIKNKKLWNSNGATQDPNSQNNLEKA